MPTLKELQDLVLEPLDESLWFNHGCAYLEHLNGKQVIVDAELNSGLPCEKTKEVYRLGVYLDDDCCEAETWIETTNPKHLLDIINGLYNGYNR